VKLCGWVVIVEVLSVMQDSRERLSMNAKWSHFIAAASFDDYKKVA
jgi:hypothetical protein